MARVISSETSIVTSSCSCFISIMYSTVSMMPSRSSCKTALRMSGLKKPKNTTSCPHVWLSTRKHLIIIARLMETTEDSLDSHSQANPGPESICSSCVVLILLYLSNAEYYDQGPLNTSLQQNGIFLVLF